ncbi:hypothetical protein DERP_010032, partial [Dermatophagoides pteronyssinus]
YIRRRFRLETITPPNQRLDGHLSLTLSYSRPNHLPSSPQKSAYQMFGNDLTTQFWKITTTQIYPILFGHNLKTTLRQTKPSAIQWLQCAFECRVIGVSCISHRLTQLAAFFLDQRAEITICFVSMFLAQCFSKMKKKIP